MHAHPPLATFGGLRAGPSGQVCHALKGLDELRTAIGVTGIINGIDPDTNVARADRLRHCQGMC